jgi:hypothetical protein
MGSPLTPPALLDTDINYNGTTYVWDDSYNFAQETMPLGRTDLATEYVILIDD